LIKTGQSFNAFITRFVILLLNVSDCMKNLVLPILFFSFFNCFSQNSETLELPRSKKGSFYAYWGWNHSAYSKSDVHFKGVDYDFTLFDLAAKDRQSPFDLKLYFNPATITIPQYNLRVGYFIKDHYSISIGEDHMKYVMVSGQTAKISGRIENSNTGYDGEYDNQSIVVAPDLLLFEHTDGLNYANIEFRRHDILFEKGNVELNLNEGFGIGCLIPRTNTTLLSKERYDQFHFSGYGFGGVLATNLLFYKRFFIQTELKGGFIHMPSIRTTMYKVDKASQSFWWAQTNVVFGVRFHLNK
jgi:hypothetical protein